MKILYLCADLGIAVLGRKVGSVHVRGLTAALARSGHTVVVATPLLHKSPWQEPASLEAPFVHLPPSPGTKAVFHTLKAFNQRLGVTNSVPGELRRLLYNHELELQLTRRFEKDPPDVIYERASLYATAGVSLARQLDVPLLLELNAPLALEQAAYRAPRLGELAAQTERWTLSGADAVLAVSAPLRDYVLTLGVDPARVHVLPNGVDASLFRPAPPEPEVRERWGLNGGPVVGFVGGLLPWHGVEALPALLARLTARYPNLRLVIAGDGPQRGAVEQGLRARGLASQAVFTGNLPHHQIAALIRQFDVALAPYPPCPHPFYFSPLKVFEYMACAGPVVAASLGQIAEVVRDGETGLLYPSGDLEALAAG